MKFVDLLEQIMINHTTVNAPNLSEDILKLNLNLKS